MNSLIKAPSFYSLAMIMYSLIFISGDHIFNKTNNLKMGLVLCSVSIIFLFVNKSLIYLKASRVFLFFLPITACIPGYYTSHGEYSYNFEYELVSQLLCVIWALFLMSHYRTFNNTNRVLAFFIPITIFVSIIGILEKLGLDPLVRFWLNPFEAHWTPKSVYSGIPERIESTFGNINYFASYLIQVLPILLAGILVSKSRTGKRGKKHYWFILFAFFIGLSCLLFTQTRAALFSFLAAITAFSFGYIYVNRLLGIQNLVKILLALSSLALLLIYVSYDRIEVLFSEAGWQPRLLPWKIAIASFQDAPIFGYGLGSSYQLFFEYAPSDGRLYQTEFSYNHVHFELIEILQEGGLVGVLAYLLFWCAVFYRLVSRVVCRSISIEQRYLFLAVFCGLLAFHIHGCFSVAPRMMVVEITAYTLVAFSFLIGSKDSQKNSTNMISAKAWSYNLLFAALIGLAWCWYVPYAYQQHVYSSLLAGSDKYSIKEESQHSSDIYLLDFAAWTAKDINDAVWMGDVLESMETEFPFYRKLSYLKAHQAFIGNDMERAKSIASDAQLKDRYLDDLGYLLGHLALKQGEPKQLLKQLGIAMKSHFCRKERRYCGKGSIDVHGGTFAYPVSIYKNKGRTTYLFDENSLEELVEANQNGLFQRGLIKYTRGILSSPFMQGLVQKLNSDQLQRVARYIELGDTLVHLKNDSHLVNSKVAWSHKGLHEQISSYLRYNEGVDQKISKLQNQKDFLERDLGTVLDLQEYEHRVRLFRFIRAWLNKVVDYK